MNLSWRGLLSPFRRAVAVEAPPDRRGETRQRAHIEAQLRWEFGRGEWCGATGVITDASPSGVGVLTRAALEPGRTVWVMRPGSTALKGVVRNARLDGDERTIGVRLVFDERRRLDRHPYASDGSLRWSGPSGATERLNIEVRNVTESGAQLAGDRAVPVGEFVRLSGAAVECAGSVRYCVRWGDEYLIGVQFIGKPALLIAAEADVAR